MCRKRGDVKSRDTYEYAICNHEMSGEKALRAGDASKAVFAALVSISRPSSTATTERGCRVRVWQVSGLGPVLV